MNDALVLSERKNNIATLTLNRPEKKNAMSNAVLAEFIDALKRANEDEEVRVIVINGAGPCFSSGRDVTQFQDASILQDRSIDITVDIFLDALSMLVESPKPTIASIHGMALGGGQAVSLACDFVVAERGARFGNIEMAYGFPAAMNIALLTRHVGRRRGLEIAMTGNMFDAQKYFEFGLINRLAEPGKLDKETNEFASLLATRAPWAVMRTKSHYRISEDMGLHEALTFGNNLNQLLRMNEQIEPVHTVDKDVRASLSGAILKSKTNPS